MAHRHGRPSFGKSSRNFDSGPTPPAVTPVVSTKRRGAAIARTKRATRRIPSRTPAESRMAGVAGMRRTHRTTQPQHLEDRARGAPVARAVLRVPRAQKRARAQGAIGVAGQPLGCLARCRGHVDRESVVRPATIGSVSVIPASHKLVGSWSRRSLPSRIR
jgi:hypothetical protein